MYGLFVPHSHDAADSIDDAMEANSSGIRALKVSLLILLATTVLQAVVVFFSGSVALLADTIHNFSTRSPPSPLGGVHPRTPYRIPPIHLRSRPCRRPRGLFIVFVVALSLPPGNPSTASSTRSRSPTSAG